MSTQNLFITEKEKVLAVTGGIMAEPLTEAGTLAGASEADTLAGASEADTLAGAREERAEKEKVMALTEAGTLAGASEAGTLAGAREEPK